MGFHSPQTALSSIVVHCGVLSRVHDLPELRTVVEGDVTNSWPRDGSQVLGRWADASRFSAPISRRRSPRLPPLTLLGPTALENPFCVVPTMSKTARPPVAPPSTSLLPHGRRLEEQKAAPHADSVILSERPVTAKRGARSRKRVEGSGRAGELPTVDCQLSTQPSGKLPVA